MATGSASGRRVGRDDDEGLLVGVRAVGVPPGALEGPAGERGRPGVRVHEAVPVGLLDGIEGATHRSQCGQGHRRGRSADGRRTGGLAVQRGWGHAREHSTGGAETLAGATSSGVGPRRSASGAPALPDERVNGRLQSINRPPSGSFDAIGALPCPRSARPAGGASTRLDRATAQRER